MSEMRKMKNSEKKKEKRKQKGLINIELISWIDLDVSYPIHSDSKGIYTYA